MTYSALRTLAANRAAVATCTIYHIESGIASRVPIPRTDLETHRHTETTVATESAAIDALVARLEAARPEPTHAETEYRWKIVFTDAAETRLLEVYAAAYAPLGMMGMQPVAFAGEALAPWLQRTYAPSELEPVV